MKTILIFAFAVCLFDISKAVDNGQYRPDLYEAQYRPNYYDNRYDYFGRYQNNNYYGRNRYYPNYNDFYQPSYYNNLRPYQQLQTPFSSVASTGVAQKAAVVSSTTAAPQVVIPKQVVVPVVPTLKQTVVPLANYPRYSGNEGNAKIVAQDSDQEANSYHFSYQTENGIHAAESGAVASNTKSGGTVVTGFYEYVGDDGVLYRVDYTADENGFHPTGKHLPQ